MLCAESASACGKGCPLLGTWVLEKHLNLGESAAADSANSLEYACSAEIGGHPFISLVIQGNRLAMASLTDEGQHTVIVFDDEFSLFEDGPAEITVLTNEEGWPSHRFSLRANPSDPVRRWILDAAGPQVTGGAYVKC